MKIGTRSKRRETWRYASTLSFVAIGTDDTAICRAGSTRWSGGSNAAMMLIMSKSRSVLFFGTFDEAAHPRVTVLIELFRFANFEVKLCNEQLLLDTSARIRLVRRPWLLFTALKQLLRCWVRLVRRGRKIRDEHFDLVVIGYLGVFDIHLAKRIFNAPLALDQMAPTRGIAVDRGLPFRRLFEFIDRKAEQAADLVIFDTEEQRMSALTSEEKTCVVKVGAPNFWFATSSAPVLPQTPLSVCFFGSFTPLQGTVVIGKAVERLRSRDIHWTFIGGGQELNIFKSKIPEDLRAVKFVDWLSPHSLSSVVAEHDVCLGIFGDSEKALNVVPNKVFQAAAAGCAIVTSDTPAQRRELGEAAIYVKPGGSAELSEALAKLDDDRELLEHLKHLSREKAEMEFSPEALAHLAEPIVMQTQRNFDRRFRR